MSAKAMDAAVDASWQKRGFLAGAIFAVLNIVSVALQGSPPALDGSGEKIAKYFVDNEGGIKVSAILFPIAIIFGIIWLASLWRVISKLEPGGPRLALMAAVGFVISGATAGVATAAMGAVAVRVDTLGGAGEFVFAFANVLFAVSLGAIAVHMLALAVLTMRSGFLPAWTSWLALVSAVTSIVGTAVAGSTASWVLPFLMIGFSTWVLWVLITSVLMFKAK